MSFTLMICLLFYYVYKIANNTDKSEKKKKQYENNADSVCIEGFIFEDSYFTTPNNTMIPYSYEFVTMLESDGSLIIHLLSLGKTEVHHMKEGDVVLKEISRRKRSIHEEH